MTEFQVKRGLSTQLFSSPGVINPRLKIVEGYWYICSDTAELFLGVNENNNLTLKKINGDALEYRVDALEADVEALKTVSLFQEIENESELPRDYSSPTFNPNITYYIKLEDGYVSTFIFDVGSESYMCANKVDLSELSARIEATIDAKMEGKIDARIEEKTPEIITDTIETLVLHGGDSEDE